MGLRLRRWLIFITMIIITLYLCWQNSKDSTNLTVNACNAVINLSSIIGLEIKLTTAFYTVVRKLGHGIMFMVLAISSYMAISASVKSTKRTLMISLFTDVAIATIAEYIQLYFSGRTASVLDLLIDTAGVVVGITAIHLITNHAKFCHHHL